MHLATAKFPIRYLAASQALLFFLAKIRNEIVRNKQTTWANADIRSSPNVFMGKLSRRIALNELGGGSPGTFPVFLKVSGDHTVFTGSAKKKKVHQLGDLINRQPNGRKRGPIEDKISTMLVYGDKQMPVAQIRIEKIRKALWEFAHQLKEGDSRRRIT